MHARDTIHIEKPVRIPLIVGNWKMNKTPSEAAAFIRDLLERLTPSPKTDVVLTPPFTSLESASKALGPSSWINLGAQLNSPLVETENVPNYALNKYFMFVNRDKRT